MSDWHDFPVLPSGSEWTGPVIADEWAIVPARRRFAQRGPRLYVVVAVAVYIRERDGAVDTRTSAISKPVPKEVAEVLAVARENARRVVGEP